MKQYLFYLSLMVASTVSLPVCAENWKRVGVTSDGAIVEIDLDSINDLGDIFPDTKSITTTDGGVFLNCKKHSYGPTAFKQSHIPGGSIAQDIEALVCRHKDSNNDKTPQPPKTAASRINPGSGNQETAQRPIPVIAAIFKTPVKYYASLDDYPSSASRRGEIGSGMRVCLTNQLIRYRDTRFAQFFLPDGRVAYMDFAEAWANYDLDPANNKKCEAQYARLSASPTN